jgi:hypothetical protein
VVALVVFALCPVKGAPSVPSPKDRASQPGPRWKTPEDWEKELQQVQTKLLESQSKTAALDNKVNALQAANSGLADQLKQSEAARTGLELKLNSLQSEKTELESKLTQTRNTAADLVGKLQQALDEKTQLEARLNQAGVEKTQLEARLRQADADKADLETRFKALQATQEAAAEQLRALQQEVERLKTPSGPQASAKAISPSAAFREGGEAYRSGDYARAAGAFRVSAAQRPASGTLQNLGLSEWQRGKAGAAILAWEQSLWLDPFNGSVRGDLRFARKTAQLESPELPWYEVVSSWLPVNWWAWISGASFWLAIGAGALPGILRLRKAVWHQALAAFGLVIFLLSLPAHLGVQTRSQLGFVLEKNAPLRLTPTEEAQFITRLASGEPVRFERTRGQFVLVHTSRSLGWLKRDQFGLIAQNPGKERTGA